MENGHGLLRGCRDDGIRRERPGTGRHTVGRVAVVADPFGNRLTLLDLSKGRYLTDADGIVTGVG
jgi:hypothetical protein